MSERQNRRDAPQDKPSDGPSLAPRVSTSDILTFPSKLHGDVIYPLESTSARDGGWRAILIKTRLYQTPVHRAPCAEIACSQPLIPLPCCSTACASLPQAKACWQGQDSRAPNFDPAWRTDDYDLSRSNYMFPCPRVLGNPNQVPTSKSSGAGKYLIVFVFFYPRVAEMLSRKVRDGHFICLARA